MRLAQWVLGGLWVEWEYVESGELAKKVAVRGVEAFEI